MCVATKVAFPHSAEKPRVKVKGRFQCERLQMEANNSVPSCWRRTFPAAAALLQILADKTGVNSVHGVHA